MDGAGNRTGDEAIKKIKKQTGKQRNQKKLKKKVDVEENTNKRRARRKK
jgi:hypothetical protein